MAGVGAEHEDQINEWMRSFEALPEERQDKLRRWFATQKIIIDNSGLTPDEWFEYVHWALENPFDYAFIKDFPDMPEADLTSDAAEKGDATKKARELVGGQTAAKGPLAGEGIKEAAKSEGGLEKELFANFMKNRRS